MSITITASGRMITSVLVFKGALEGFIATQDFCAYPCRCIYACQSLAWMDEVVMLQWGGCSVKALSFGGTSHVVPLLFLDSYRFHMMASVVSWINELGVEVQHIPGGCTGLCQPVDIGVAKPLKDNLKN